MPKGLFVPGRTRSPVDGLTVRERAIVKARLERPGATLLEIAEVVGLKVSSKRKRAGIEQNISRVLRRPRIIAALTMPPPTVDETAKKKLSQMSVVERKTWLIDFYQTVVDNEIVPMSERIRAANTLAEMTEGAKVPVGINHSGVFNLEQFVAAAGGKPADAPGRPPENMPN
jgi:hypothetical protein